MSRPKTCQPKGGQPWRPSQPTPGNPKIANLVSKSQTPNLTAAENDVRIAVNAPTGSAIVPPVPIAGGRPVPKLLQFFNRELERVQRRFNETFGRQVAVNLQTRCEVMLAIVNLMLLHRKIKAADNPEVVRSEIVRFVKSTRVLYRIFDRSELNLQSGRTHRYEKQAM